MEKLNELVKLAGKVLSPENAFEGVDAKFEWKAKANPTAILAIAEAFRALEQRAEEAEAKLAELERQEPVAYSWRSFKKAQLTRTMPESWKQPRDIKPLFTRPAPAINLAEMVPEERSYAHYIDSGTFMTMHEALRLATEWNYCRAAMLRNIEEHK